MNGQSGIIVQYFAITALLMGSLGVCRGFIKRVSYLLGARPLWTLVRGMVPWPPYMKSAPFGMTGRSYLFLINRQLLLRCHYPSE